MSGEEDDGFVRPKKPKLTVSEQTTELVKESFTKILSNAERKGIRTELVPWSSPRQSALSWTTCSRHRSPSLPEIQRQSRWTVICRRSRQ